MDMKEVLKFLPTGFAMPGNPATDRYLLPVSGGADSSALAILLHALFPGFPFELVFTDTEAEEPEIYTTLNALESYLGKPIIRIAPERGLFALIEHFKGYLPSAQARWCTRELKLRSFARWIERYKGQQKYMFVGIRNDESQRLAFTIDEVETVLPFIDMNVCRKDVYAILDKTIGIPRFYQRRTRSGCSVCPFQRRSELVGLLQEKPVEFVRGMRYEKLPDSNLLRHEPAIPLWQDTRTSANWLSLPLPPEDVQINGKRPKLTNLSLFGERGIFVGGEFFFDGMYDSREFIWHQRVVTYSPTLAGLSRQLDDRYQHLLGTAEVFGMTPDEVRRQCRFAIWYVELPEFVFDPEGPGPGGYTWQPDGSYKQMRHIVSWVTRALNAERMRQEATRPVRPDTVYEEWQQSSLKSLGRATEPLGAVAVSQWYQPSEEPREMTLEEEVSSMPCPMCSI